jgi:rhodanese-related sulfurtransferase
LIDSGIDNVYTLDGGYGGWAAAGNPIEQGM